MMRFLMAAVVVAGGLIVGAPGAGDPLLNGLRVEFVEFENPLQSGRAEAPDTILLRPGVKPKTVLHELAHLRAGSVDGEWHHPGWCDTYLGLLDEWAPEWVEREAYSTSIRYGCQTGKG